METSTKERLTGALLVVLALVVVVPELLSGRRPTHTGDLPAQNPEEGAPLQTYNVQLNAPDTGAAAPRDVPAAAAAQIAAVPPPVTSETPPVVNKAAAAPSAGPAAPARPIQEPAPAPAPAQPVSKKKAVKPAASATGASAGQAAPSGWWVQLGGFSSDENAQRLARKMRKAGFPIQVSRERINGKELHMVRAGPVADRAAATALQGRLAAAGQKKSLLVAP